MMRILFFAAFALLLTACGNNSTPPAPVEKTPAPVVNASTSTDSTAVVATLHDFFTWYKANAQILNKFNIGLEKGKHLQLNEPVLAQYLAEYKKSGLVSDEFIADETKFYRACAKLWQNEEIGDVPSGMDADRYYCSQDLVDDYVTAPVRATVTADRALATLLPSAEMSVQFELVKENGAWLLAKVKCDCGVAY